MFGVDFLLRKWDWGVASVTCGPVEYNSRHIDLDFLLQVLLILDARAKAMFKNSRNRTHLLSRIRTLAQTTKTRDFQRDLFDFFAS
jgi:hypothetical protein